MKIPEKIGGLRLFTVLVGLYSVVWISLEGALWQVVLLGTGMALLGGLHATQRLLGGRHVSARFWLLICAVLGGGVGLSCALLTLLFMAIKTGLHGHGPEFTAAEIEWLVRQIPMWAIAGTAAGLGLGVLALAFRPHEEYD